MCLFTTIFLKLFQSILPHERKLYKFEKSIQFDNIIGLKLRVSA